MRVVVKTVLSKTIRRGRKIDYYRGTEGHDIYACPFTMGGNGMLVWLACLTICSYQSFYLPHSGVHHSHLVFFKLDQFPLQLSWVFFQK